jgi:PAS domain-containing protein
MTTIHDEESGSRMRELEGSLRRTELERDALACRKDELETVLAVGGMGFCRVAEATRALTANSQFKAEFGWPPDTHITWRELTERVQRADRGKLEEAVTAAFTANEEVDLIVRTQGKANQRQWLALRGRITNSADGAVTDLILTSRNVSSARRAAAGRQRERMRSWVGIAFSRSSGGTMRRWPPSRPGSSRAPKPSSRW